MLRLVPTYRFDMYGVVWLNTIYILWRFFASWTPENIPLQSHLSIFFFWKAPVILHFHILNLFFRTLIYGLTVGFARRCNPFGRRKVARTLTCIKIIPAFSAETEPKGVRVLATSCGRRAAEHDACYFEKEAENAAIFARKIYCRGIVVSCYLSRSNTARNGSDFAFIWLVGYFPDTLIYLAETAVVFDVSNW